MPDEFVLVGSFKYVPDRQEYIGLVCKQQGRELVVLNIGAEMSEMDILLWIKDTIELMRKMGRTDVQAPDMYDRRLPASQQH